MAGMDRDSAIQTGNDSGEKSGVGFGLLAHSVVNSQKLIAGIDEAGRGCLAGPVVAAAVILPASCQIVGLADSKKLSARQRQSLLVRIRAESVSWAVGLVRPARIDGINILEAALEAMALAAGRLKKRPASLLIDGNKVIPARVLERHWRSTLPLPTQKAIVDGDALVPVISAASILAKTFRDRIMEAMDRRWPGYGFARHKGYGTRAHYAALAEIGPCQQHRLSFRGVRS